MARHVSGPDPQLKNMRIGHAWLLYLAENQIEQLKTWGRGHEAICPSAHKGSVMKFVLRTNKSTHRIFLNPRIT